MLIVDGFVFYFGTKLIYRRLTSGRSLTAQTELSDDSTRQNSPKSKKKTKKRDFQVFKLAFFVLVACIVGLIVLSIYLVSSFTLFFEDNLNDVILQKFFEPLLLFMPLGFFLSGNQAKRFFMNCKQRM